LFAVVHIPDFELQAVLRHEPDLLEQPVALVENDSARATVWQITPVAGRFGVSPGMTTTQAKARCERMAFRIRSAQQEKAGQEVLLECAYLSAAYIESTAPGVCTMDLRGLPLLKAERLDEGLRKWAEQLRTRLRTFHFNCQIGVAAAPGLALQAAQGRFERDEQNGGSPGFYHVTDASQFWNRLPIESLMPERELFTVVSKWGIKTVAQFLALGRGPIAERLGEAGLELFNRAKADTIRPLRLTSPTQTYEEFFEFEQLVETLEPLLFIVRRLLEQLTRRVEQRALSITEITLMLRLESGETHENPLKIAAPTRDTNVLFRITHNFLETIRTSSPVVAVSIRVKPCEIDVEQFQLFETSVRDPNRFYETIGRLSALLGPDRVGTPVLRDSYRPDDFAMKQPSPNESSSKARQTEALASKTPTKRGLALRRFRPPLPAKVRLRDGAPIFVESSGPSGSISNSRGPWRSSGNWWENPWTREEWDIELKQGEIYRLFLENNQWFVEGAYD